MYKKAKSCKLTLMVEVTTLSDSSNWEEKFECSVVTSDGLKYFVGIFSSYNSILFTVLFLLVANVYSLPGAMVSLQLFGQPSLMDMSLLVFSRKTFVSRSVQELFLLNLQAQLYF